MHNQEIWHLWSDKDSYKFNPFDSANLIDKVPEKIIPNTEITFWVNSIAWRKEFLDRINKNNSEKLKAERIKQFYLDHKNNKEKNYKSQENLSWYFNEINTVNALFNQIIEIVVWELLRAYFSSLNEFKNCHIFDTSYHDNVNSWADYVMCLDKTEQNKQYIAIDFSTAENEETLDKKYWSKHKTCCKDFSDFLWLKNPYELKFPRIVLIPEPNLIFLVVNEYMKEIISWKKEIKAYDCYLKVLSDYNRLSYWNFFNCKTKEEVTKGFKEKINEILLINNSTNYDEKKSNPETGVTMTWKRKYIRIPIH